MEDGVQAFQEDLVPLEKPASTRATCSPTLYCGNLPEPRVRFPYALHDGQRRIKLRRTAAKSEEPSPRGNRKSGKLLLAHVPAYFSRAQCTILALMHQCWSHHEYADRPLEEQHEPGLISNQDLDHPVISSDGPIQ